MTECITVEGVNTIHLVVDRGLILHVVPLFRGNNGMNENFMYSKQIETNVYEHGLIVLKKIIFILWL